jgi:hypothetical protein
MVSSFLIRGARYIFVKKKSTESQKPGGMQILNRNP